MAQFIVRHLEETVKARLKRRAARRPAGGYARHPNRKHLATRNVRHSEGCAPCKKP
jgi:hypothetical protein